jgi:DNA-binding response OmpR family regulator
MTKFNILLSEDDPDDLFIFEKAIGEILPEIKIKHVYTGQQTVAHLLAGIFMGDEYTQLPDIILADLNSPFFVLETIREIRIYQQFDHIPIYIFSNDETQETLRLSLEAGATAFYKKPRSFNELNSIMRSIIPRHRPSTIAKTVGKTGHASQ